MSWIDELQHEYQRVQAGVADGPILPTVAVDEIRGYLASRYDFQNELPLDEVIQDAERMLRTWQVQVTHPRYLGLFNPAVTLPAVIAETLVALYNPQLANWRTSPAGNEIERHTLGWLAAKFGLPEDTIATFTSGGSEANSSAVAVALSHTFAEYGEHGLRSLPAPPSLYLTGEAHHGFNKIAHLTGIGRQAVRLVKTDRRLRLDVESLRRQVRQDREDGWAPFLVVGTAGTTAAGVIDPLAEIAQLCREESLWFHADAAWGGAAILSPALKKHLAGIEHADSITCDAHKLLSVPMGCGMFFCRHRESVARAFHADVTYVSGKQSGPVFDPLTNSAQWSRRFIGLKLFMALANLGEQGYAAMIEHQARLGNVLRQALAAAGWQIVNETPLPLVCFTREHLDPAAFLSALHRRQIAWMSEARIGGAAVLRACITNFRTTEADIHQIVEEMNQLYQHGGGCAQAAAGVADDVGRVREPDKRRTKPLASIGVSMKRETLAIHAGYEPDAAARSVAVPIYQTVAYAFDSAEHAAALFNLEAEGYRYTRISNPTTAVLERRMAALEGGFEAMCVATGQAAVNYAVLNLASMGSNIVSPPQLYGTTHTLFAHMLPEQGVAVRFAESDHPEAIERLIDAETRAIYCESVGNPAGNICDIEVLAQLAHRHGIPLVVDNTVATPMLLRPIEYGADIVVHSLTKFMGGHGTTLGGVIVDSGNFPWTEYAARFPMFCEPDHSYHGLVYSERFGRAAYIARCRSRYLRATGAVLAPLSAFLLLQGVETAALRVERHVENGRKVAEFLRGDPRVTWVKYAGFPDNPYYTLAQKYLNGQGCSLMTLGVNGGYQAAIRFYDALKLVSRLVNLGDAKSLACHPASTTHRQMSPDEQHNAGVLPEMIRLSIGIEHIDDILADLDQALTAAM